MKRKNYRKPKVSSQDIQIGKAFKICILRSKLEAKFISGFIPVWPWNGVKVEPVGYEYIHKDCIILPNSGEHSLRSFANKIRREKSVAEFCFEDKDGNTLYRPIADFTEKNLLRVLKNLSWIVVPVEDYKKHLWFSDSGEKYIVLRPEQLSSGQRISKIPLRELIIMYVEYTINHGEVNWDYDHQLLHEHRLSCAEIKKLTDAVNTLNKGDKSMRAKLKDEVSQIIDDLCESRKKVMAPLPAWSSDEFTSLIDPTDHSLEGLLSTFAGSILSNGFVNNECKSRLITLHRVSTSDVGTLYNQALSLRYDRKITDAEKLAAIQNIINDYAASMYAGERVLADPQPQKQRVKSPEKIDESLVLRWKHDVRSLACKVGVNWASQFASKADDAIANADFDRLLEYGLTKKSASDICDTARFQHIHKSAADLLTGKIDNVLASLGKPIMPCVNDRPRYDGHVSAAVADIELCEADEKWSNAKRRVNEDGEPLEHSSEDS